MIAVVMPMFNHNEMTKQCVKDTMRNAGCDIDIIVVDDHSDIPFEFKHNRVQVLRLPKNVGYTNATNAGILYCKDRYEFIHLQNNDIVPEPDYILKLWEVMRVCPEIGIANSVRILPGHEPNNIEIQALDLLSGYQQMSDGTNLPDVIHVHWAPLVSSLVRMETIRHIGLLDRKMHTYCSDNDYCMRTNLADWQVSVVTGSRVVHNQGSSGGQSRERIAKDQLTLLDKISNKRYAEWMKMVPLDMGNRIYGKLEFVTEVR